MLNYGIGSITDMSTARVEPALSEAEGSDILVRQKLDMLMLSGCADAAASPRKGNYTNEAAQIKSPKPVLCSIEF
jgi:hypothetical protein